MIPKKILVIEDNADLLELLEIVFRGAGHEVVLSEKSLEADYIRLLHPDLILLDVRISGSEKNGAQICKDLKSGDHTGSFPVILLSAEDHLKTIAAEGHAEQYICRPFELNYLLQQVRNFLS